ncbi:MAG: 50S ribosomal protein L7/L12 [Clostridia bacterium]|nr:50S ribosomal protein L7/L12 [Clostridia bacterium]
MASEKIAKIVDAVAELSVLELSELVKEVEDRFGVSAAAPVAVMAGPAAGPVEEEKTEFDVALVGFDAAAKIKVIKVVREITGLGLKEAKDAVEGAASEPKVLKEAAPKEEAEEIKKKLEEAGAKVELK